MGAVKDNYCLNDFQGKLISRLPQNSLETRTRYVQRGSVSGSGPPLGQRNDAGGSVAPGVLARRLPRTAEIRFKIIANSPTQFEQGS